jgi:hypothetical protein
LATVDIPGAFIHAEIDDKVHMQLYGKMEEELVQFENNRYQKCLVMEENTKILYMKPWKALDGTLKAALLLETSILQVLGLHCKSA